MSQKRTIPTLNNGNYLDILQKNGLSEDQFWSRTLQKMIVLGQENFVFTKLAKKERIPKNAGTKTWSTRRYLHLPVDLDKGALAEGVAPQPMRVEGKMVSGTVNQYGAYIELTDVANDIHFDDIFQIYQPELARHAAETIERDLINAVEAEASVAFAGAATSKATLGADSRDDVITFEDLRRAWLTMKNHRRNGHPSAGGKPIFVAHPNIMQDLLDDEDIIADLIIVPGYDEKIIKTGSINQYTIYGIYLMETSVLEPELVGSNLVHKTFLIGDSAFVHLALGSNDVKWYKKGFVADSNDPLGQKATVGYKLWTGGKVIDPMAVKVIHTLSSFDSQLENFAIDEDARPASQNITDTSVLTVRKAPNKVTYETDEEFDPAGMLVSYNDAYGSDILVGVETLTFTYDFSTTGAKNVTISYTEKVDEEVTITKTVTQAVTVA